MRAFVFVLSAMIAGCGLEVEGLVEGDGGATDARQTVPPRDGEPSDGKIPPGRDSSSSDAPSPPPDGGADAPRDALPDGPPDSPPKDAPEEKSMMPETGPDAAPDGGIDITGGSYTILPTDSGECSTSGTTATSFTLYNDRTASVDLDWISYSCKETNYGTIAAGGSHPQGTYVTHVWLIRDHASKAALYEFVLDAAGTYTVTVH
jgi:hypothetical protein